MKKICEVVKERKGYPKGCFDPKDHMQPPHKYKKEVNKGSIVKDPAPIRF